MAVILKKYDLVTTLPWVSSMIGRFKELMVAWNKMHFSQYYVIGRIRRKKSCSLEEVGFGDFNEFVDLPFEGKKFTRFRLGNKRIWLDQFLVSVEWLLQFQCLHQKGLKRFVSDHCPVLLIQEEVD